MTLDLHIVGNVTDEDIGHLISNDIAAVSAGIRIPACIPKWYRFGMSTQIAVRLSDDMVAFIDELVSRGEGSSRAAVVSRALERERRRKIAERDAAILAGEAPDADLDRLAEFAAATPMPDLD
jgi:Arc/MetJ-type ribon-helix-helix transcriptional regulator